MAGVVLIGAIAVFLAGLGVGLLIANIALHRGDRRSRSGAERGFVVGSS